MLDNWIEFAIELENDPILTIELEVDLIFAGAGVSLASIISSLLEVGILILKLFLNIPGWTIN